MTLAGLGITIGLTAAWSLARVMAGLLFGVSPRDPVIFVAVPLLFAAVALLAVSLPARQACQATPMSALRYE